MDKKDDLYVIEHGPYYVTFDWYTPRAHMIILGNDRSKIHFLKTMRPTGKEMDKKEKQAMFDIANMVYEKLPKIKDQTIQDLPNVDSPVVMSIHYGSWFGKASVRFHAHVCIPNSIYENWISKYKSDPVLLYKLKNKRKSDTYETYVQKVKRAANDYTEDDMKLLNSTLGKKGFSDDWTKLAFHRNYMRVGFITKEPKDNLALLSEMEAFILRHDLHVEGKGGHMCIDLTSKGFSGYNRLSDNTVVEKSHVPCYLQLPGDVFGMILLGAKQDKTWMSNDHHKMGVNYT